MDNPLIFSSQASRYFAERLFSGSVQEISRRTFSGGERYYQIEITNRTDLIGKDVVFVAASHTDADILEIQRVGCALAAYGARRRVFVIPFFGYSTMERAKLPGEVVTAKTNMRILSSIPNTGGGNIFLFLDLHSEGLVHYMEGDCLRFELYAEAPLVDAIKSLELGNFIFGSADLGRPKWIRTFARIFGTDLVLIDKSRNFEETKVNAVIGNPAGKTVIIYDDMVRSAGSLVDAAESYLAHGATGVYAVVSHLALNDESVVQRIESSPIKLLVATNSHPMSRSEAVYESEKIRIVDVSQTFRNTIRNL